MNNNLPLKTEANKRFNAMVNLHQRWVPALKDLSAYIDPTRGIFNNDRSKVGKMIDHKTLLDSHATHAKRITASGMQTGMTDPSRPWFRLSMDNLVLDNVPGVRQWLDEVTRIMIETMNKSNMYKVFQNCYDELVTFGTGCFLILEDFDDTIRGRSFTAGEYYLATNCKGRVNAFGREFVMTVGQLVEEFGLESVSGQVKAYWGNNQIDIPITIRHLIEANETRIPGYQDFENMPFRSLYWETGGEGFLATRGYKKFPVIAPRWDAITTDSVYGYGPGWHAIGDIKQLQATTKDMLLAQEKLHKPPMIEDGSVNNSNYLPGGVTKTSSSVPNSGSRPAYQINPNLDSFMASIDSLYQKIDRHLFADIFLMITRMEQSNVTAFEIAKREQEKMMMLGPILHSLNEEMHDEAIDLIFDVCVDSGLFPPAPEGLEGNIKVQYISILAQAQKAMGVQQIQGTIGYVANIAAVFPQAVDLINIDEAVKQMSEMSGNDASIILNPEQVAALREANAKQQMAMANMQAGVEAVDAASTLGKTPGKGSGSALDNLLQGASR